MDQTTSQLSTLNPELLLSRKLAGLLLGLAVSAFALWWAIPAGGLRSLPGYLASADTRLLFLTVVVASTTFIIRAVRWRLLLQAEGGITTPWSASWHATAIGFMANNILPLRLGEIVRALAVSKLSATRFPAAVASVAVERVFDALTVVGLFALALASGTVSTDLKFGNTSATTLVTSVAVLGLAVLVAAGIGAIYPEWAERVLRKVVPWPKVADKLAGPLHSFAHGLRVLHDPRRIALVVFWSVALWTVNAWSFGLAFKSFGLQGDIAFAIVVQTFVVFGVAAPAGPGYAGVFELAMVLAATLFGIPAAAAVAVALSYHILTYIPITLLGAWSLHTTGLKLGDLKNSPPA